jgi:hypothetical protein
LSTPEARNLIEEMTTVDQRNLARELGTPVDRSALASE